MDTTIWEKILKQWQADNYMSVFVYAGQIIALVTAIKYRQKEKLYYLFLVYINSALLLLFSIEFLGRGLLNLKNRESTVFSETGNICFALIEYIVFYHFFNKVLRSRTAKRLMILFLLYFFFMLITFLVKIIDPSFTRSNIRHHSDWAISSELLFLGSLCILHYYELIRKKPVSNLLQSPSFWIVSGLFFYCFLFPPFLIIAEPLFLSLNKTYLAFYSVHYISFGVLFLAIAKALSCNRALTS